MENACLEGVQAAIRRMDPHVADRVLDDVARAIRGNESDPIVTLQALTRALFEGVHPFREKCEGCRRAAEDGGSENERASP